MKKTIKNFNDYTSYLSNCDLASKYNISNIITMPKIEKIILELPVEEILKKSEKNITKKTIKSARIQSFLILLFFSSYLPKIHFDKKSKLFSLKILLQKKLDLDSFLFLFFNDNGSSLRFKNFKFLKDDKKIQKKIEFNVKASIFSFDEINLFLTKAKLISNFTEVFFNIRFLFDDFILNNVKNYSLVLKNLPLFWLMNTLVIKKNKY